MKVKLEHIFDVDLETFERLWSDESVIKAVVEKLPNVSERIVEEERNEGEYIYRKVLYKGNAQIPEIAKKIISPDQIKWYEITKYYPKEHRYDFEMIPGIFRDKIRFEGRVKLIPEGKKTRRIIEGELKINLDFMTRKIVEKFLKDFMERNMSVEAKVLNEEMKSRV